MQLWLILYILFTNPVFVPILQRQNCLGLPFQSYIGLKWGQWYSNWADLGAIRTWWQFLSADTSHLLGILYSRVCLLEMYISTSKTSTRHIIGSNAHFASDFAHRKQEYSKNDIWVRFCYCFHCFYNIFVQLNWFDLYFVIICPISKYL